MPTMIRADVAKNWLYLVLDGIFGEPEVKQAVVATLTEAKKLKPGFAIINDIIGFKPTYRQAGDAIQQTQAVLLKQGMKRVVRVVGSNVIGSLQFETRGKQAGYQGVKIETAATVQEAERLLSRGNS